MNLIEQSPFNLEIENHLLLRICTYAGLAALPFVVGIQNEGHRIASRICMNR